MVPVKKKLWSNRLAWDEHVTRSDKSYITRRQLNIKVDVYRKRGRPKNK